LAAETYHCGQLRRRYENVKRAAPIQKELPSKKKKQLYQCEQYCKTRPKGQTVQKTQKLIETNSDTGKNAHTYTMISGAGVSILAFSVALTAFVHSVLTFEGAQPHCIQQNRRKSFFLKKKPS
jgi:hypothetical protein